jgi:monoamine oxidase
VRYFGDEARDYVDFYEKLWNKEEYTGGCPVVGVTSSGVMKDYAAATREPFVHVHFCGTESATEWIGYMDGAAESGERAAYEVLRQLFKEHESYKELQPSNQGKKRANRKLFKFL